MPTALVDMPHDPATGFLESPNFDGFTVAKKSAFIEYLMMPNTPPSLYKALAGFGLSNGTFAYHLARDKAFAQKIDEVKRHRARVHVEGRLFEDAENPDKSNTLAQLAVLRAYMPERYARMELMAPASNIQITVNGSVSTKLDQVVDAELVDGESASIPKASGNIEHNTNNPPCTTQSVDSQEEAK